MDGRREAVQAEEGDVGREAGPVPVHAQLDGTCFERAVRAGPEDFGVRRDDARRKVDRHAGGGEWW